MDFVRKRITAYFPELLALVFCGAILCWTVGLKEGYHMDELLSFELANAEFNPWIVPTQPQGRLAKFVENEIRAESFGGTMSNLAGTVKDVLANRGNSKLLSYKADVYEEPVWIDRQAFADYITVDKQDDFNYLSVYFNVKDDNHPPLHFMALHTISSVFKGRIAPFMGCAINVICVLGAMVLLMRLGRDVMTVLGQKKAGRFTGIAAALLYGVSGGALATTLLIRMYAMLTFWCVALLAIHVRKLYSEQLCPENEGKAGFEKNNKCLILVTALGFWTQYFFLFYCLLLAAVTALILWRQRRHRELWRYARSMLIAAILGVGLFPFSVSDVFSSGRGVEALQNLGAGLSGYGSRLAVFAEITWQRMGIYLLPVLLAACAVLWGICLWRKKVPKSSLWLVLSIPLAGYFLLAARMAPYLVDRYIMPVFPLLALFAAVALVYLLLSVTDCGTGFGQKGYIAVGGILIVLLLCRAQASFWENGSAYLYREYDGQKKIAEQYADCPCICVYQGVGYYENLIEFTLYDRTLLLTAEELENREETASVADLDRVVVLVKQREEEQRIRRILQEKYGLYPEKMLWDNGDPDADELILFQSGDGEK